MAWTSITDRLPEPNQEVIIHWNDDWLPLTAIYKPDHHKQFLIAFRPDMGIDEVAYWMALPEQPKIKS